MQGDDPVYIIASVGDSVIPLERVRQAVPPNVPVSSIVGIQTEIVEEEMGLIGVSSDVVT